MPSPSSTAGRRNAGWVYEDVVDAAAAGGTALAFYAGRYRHSTPAQWRQRLEAGQMRRATGRAAGDAAEVLAPDTVLARGDRLRYHRPPWVEPPAPRGFAVLFQDEHVLAVAKPGGLQVLPAASFLETTLLHGVRQKRGTRWAPVHRLGRGTSGLVLFAGSDVARRRLSAAFRDGGLRKVYRALVQGRPISESFEVTAPIGRLEHPGLGHVWAACEDGKPSRSRVRVLERRDADGTLVEIEIPTGRPHQIRIHMAWAGHPLVGEPLYGVGGRPRRVDAGAAGERPPLPGDLGYHLHAARVCFTHPASGAPVEVGCAPPPRLRTAAGL